MTDLIYYSNPQSRGRTGHWILTEMDLSFETRWVNYGPEMKSPPFSDLNPMGKVPVLVHKGAVVTEVAAICAYLGDAFPEKGLIPAHGTPERAAFYRWLFFVAGPMTSAFEAKAYKWEVPEGMAGSSGFGSYELAFGVLENHLKSVPYLCGDQVTTADFYLSSMLSWGMEWNIIESRDAFVTYRDRMMARPSFAKVNDWLEAESESLKASNP